MWHEARKHEKKIRGIMMGHRRRAERRREFYESIRRDPASYLQIHGQQMKIHIDPAISQAAESSLVPWMGDRNNMIDRFDVRANLDYIPTSADVGTGDHDNVLTADQEWQLNYERYRNLVQNDYVENDEQKVLQRIILKEQWGQQQQNNVKSKDDLKKKLSEKKAAIGYNYGSEEPVKSSNNANNEESSSGSDESDEEEELDDMDTIVFVDQLDPDMCQRLNNVAKKYGIKSGSFIKFMQADKAEADRLKIAKEIENEKSMFVGRKSRRERKVLIQQRLLILRSINTDDCEVDHFGGEGDGTKPKKTKSDSESSSEDDDDSKSEIEEGKIEFITSFGNEDDGDENKNLKKKLKKLEKKKLKEKEMAKKKLIKPEKLKITNNNNSSNNRQLMYGPTLPNQNLANDSDKDSSDNVRFNSKSNSSQIKNRRYRFNRNSDDERRFSHSPERPVRRSPSVRRRHSSEDDSSDDSHGRRSRSRRSPHSYRGTRYRSPIRYRRSKSPRRHRRSRSQSWRRSRSSSRDRSSNRHRDRRSSYRRRSRSHSRRRSPARHRKSRSNSVRRHRKSDRSSPRPLKSSKISKENPPKIETENSKFEMIVKKVMKSPETTKSIEKTNEILAVPEEMVKEKPPPIKRYYRHDLVEENSDDDDVDESETKSQEIVVGSNTTMSSTIDTNKLKINSPLQMPVTGKPGTSAVITPQERLKRLMQAQLDKQYKLDKKAEINRLEKKKLERIEREEEFSKLTRRRRERRSESDRSRSPTWSRSLSPSSSNSRRSSSSERRRHHRKRYSSRRSRSRSPERKRKNYRRRSVSRSPAPSRRIHRSSSRSS